MTTTSYTRRHFLRQTSLGLAASALAVPYLARASQNPQELDGTVCSGSGGSAIPIPGARVTVYEATSGAPRLRGTATTDSSGMFSIRLAPPGLGSGGVFYVTADLPSGLQLVTIIGSSVLPFVVINERTTIAAGYAMAQFATQGVVMGNALGLQIAAGMNDNLVSPVTGGASSVLESSPNGDETISLRSTGSLANLLALFVRHNGEGIDVLYALATPPGGGAPSNLLQALSNIARYPQQNVAQLYALATQVLVHTPALTFMPDAWTIVVKVNDTGDDNYLWAGPGNIAFDADGYAWISNNVVQGKRYSSQFGVVLKPNGAPSDGTKGKPKSPLLGGGLLGGGFGVSIGADGHVWFGNFGWGGSAYYPSATGNGSVSEFTKTGQPISGPLGYQGGPVRAQAVVPDAEGNIWIASFGNDRIYVFLKGNPNHSIYFQEPSGSGPFDIQFARDGTAWVTNNGGLGPNSNSSIARYVSGTTTKLKQLLFKCVGHSVKGMALDSEGLAWLAAGGDNRVYLVNDQGDKLGAFCGGGVTGPWGIAVDGDDNVWVANFGPEQFGNVLTSPCLTKLAGGNPATRPPGLQRGDPISPPTGYTLPSAGDQVLMHNGEPLYGCKQPPSYIPLMRMTNAVIDRAGNVWVTNNWKPDFNIDQINPGGDGICIFVGAAKPTAG